MPSFKAHNCNNCIDPPPSYSSPSSSAMLTGPATPIDTEDGLTTAQTPEYIDLKKRLRAMYFLGIFYLTLMMFRAYFAIYTDSEIRRLKAEIDICKAGMAAVLGPNATNNLRPRNLNGRWCTTGYKTAELVLEARVTQAKYGNKDRLWPVPCSETGAFVYPDDVLLEFDYVVLRS